MNRTDLAMIVRTIFLSAVLGVSAPVLAAPQPATSDVYIPTREELERGEIEIIAGEEKTIYEYRVAGRLIAIKVIPAFGPPYYMAPADGSAHFESLDHSEALYPKWILFEW